ncbi:MAG: DrmB family protein, partial [Microcystaceae cyanobacterium]
MSKSNKKRPPSGEIRQGQILSTFGPGSMVDLPDYSILIGGLNHWRGDKKRIYEERLADRVAEILGVEDIALYAPPVDEQDPKASRTGITAFAFPTWFVAQVEETWPKPSEKAPNTKVYRTRPLLPWGSLVSGKYLNAQRRKVPVVPVRFVQACVNGHISDINWSRFVHEQSQANCRGQMWLDEGGSGNDFADIFVRCEACKARRQLSDATVPNGKVLGKCEGHRPWLGPKAQELFCISEATGKPEYNRLLVRSASNAYFSEILSVISLPDSDAALQNAVNLVYEDFLQYTESRDEVKKERRKQKVAAALEGFSDDTVWAEIQRRQGGQGGQCGQYKSIKQVEIETLLSSPVEVGEDVPDGDFYARARKLANLKPKLLSRIERIVLVHRLREVIAQVGFTRFEAAMPDIDGELDIQVRRAALDIEPTWVPAIENKGEGVFIAFRKEAIEDWLQRDTVKQ